MAAVLPYIPDQNLVLITGRVITQPTIRYVGESGLEICEFVLESKREPRKNNSDGEESDAKNRPTADAFNVVIKGDGAEAWSRQLQEGTHVRIHGLFQSRSYYRRIPDETLSEIAEIYAMSHLELPVPKPGRKEEQPIAWDKLLRSGLLDMIPDDDKSQPEGKFQYVVTPAGKVFKQTRHIRYEILADSIEVIEPPEDGIDENRIVLVGKLAYQPRMAYVTDEQIPLCQFAVICRRAENSTTDLIHCIRWGEPGEKIAREFSEGDRVKISGRIQARPYEKEIKVKRGKKKKVMKVQKVAYEVSVAKVSRVAEKADGEPMAEPPATEEEPVTGEQEAGQDLMAVADAG